MKRLIISVGFLATVAGFIPAYADFNCRADVSYSWKKDKEEQPIVVFFSTAQASGADEAAAKNSLTDINSREQAKAMADCRKDHENRSGCIAAKYTSNANIIQIMKAEARKALEDAIISDCAAAQGTCLKASVTEAKCAENVKAEATPTPAAGKDAKGGAAKKK